MNINLNITLPCPTELKNLINDLNYNQLWNMRDVIEDMITKKENEKKIPMWVVRDNYDKNCAAFVIEDYEKAVQRLNDEIFEYSQRFEGKIAFTLEKLYFNRLLAEEMLTL